MRTVLMVIAALSLLATPLAPRAIAQSDARNEESVDVIRFNGATYLASAYLSQDDLDWSAHQSVSSITGVPVGAVSSQQIAPADAFAYPNEPCHWTIPDAAAPSLFPGDLIYAMPGYSTNFRLAVQHDNEVRTYQVWCNDEARVGADLFDIYGRVQRISITGDLSERSGFAVIDDPAVIADLTDMMLTGKVVPEEESSGAPVSFQMIVQLNDGTTYRISTSPGELLWGLSVVEVPPAFDQILAAAWPP